jgi:undecaprenyl-diphosphatase
MDTAVLQIINRHWTNPFLDWLMATVTNFDVWMPLLFIVVPLIIWKGGFSGRAFLVVVGATIAITDGVFTQLSKDLIERPRPHEALAEVRQVNLQKVSPRFLAVFRPPRVQISEPPVAEVKGRSFPSGHAMTNTVIATLAILFFGLRGAWYIVPAGLVAYSRIYCGAHWPSDILVSIILAVGFSLVIAALLSFLYKHVARRWLPGVYEKHPSLVGSPIAS